MKSPRRAFARARSVGIALLAAVAFASPAAASDQITINNSDAYVDAAVAEQFITVPTLCSENPNPNNPSLPAATTACNELGRRALDAIRNVGPDEYWESASTPLATTNAFVPGNVGSAVNNTGYAPLFSDHKYDLFGRAGDIMGPLTRREILFMASIQTTGGGITVSQTEPGKDTYRALVARVLIEPEGATTVTTANGVFDIADLPTYERATTFTTGKLDTIISDCETFYSAIPEPFDEVDYCNNILNPEDVAVLWITLNAPELQPEKCGSNQTTTVNTSNCLFRDKWMDQIVVGYVEAWESLGGDLHFAQNFRSQVGYDGLSSLLDGNTETWVDFRLQQSVELSGAFTTEASDPGDLTTPGDNADFEAGRQTFEQTLATESLQDFGWVFADRDSKTLGQLVSQDVEGYFFSCINCDTPYLISSGAAHAFAPAKLDLTYMEYSSGWNVVPTVIHAP